MGPPADVPPADAPGGRTARRRSTGRRTTGRRTSRRRTSGSGTNGRGTGGSHVVGVPGARPVRCPVGGALGLARWRDQPGVAVEDLTGGGIHQHAAQVGDGQQGTHVVGRQRPVPREVTRRVGQAEQRGHGDLDVDHHGGVAAPTRRVDERRRAVSRVQGQGGEGGQEVSAALVGGPLDAGGAIGDRLPTGQLVQPLREGPQLLGRQQGPQAAHAVRLRSDADPARVPGVLLPLGGGPRLHRRLDLEHQGLDVAAQSRCGPAPGVVAGQDGQEPAVDLAGDRRARVAGRLQHHARLGQQRLPGPQQREQLRLHRHQPLRLRQETGGRQLPQARASRPRRARGTGRPRRRRAAAPRASGWRAAARPAPRTAGPRAPRTARGRPARPPRGGRTAPPSCPETSGAVRQFRLRRSACGYPRLRVDNRSRALARGPGPRRTGPLARAPVHRPRSTGPATGPGPRAPIHGPRSTGPGPRAPVHGPRPRPQIPGHRSRPRIPGHGPRPTGAVDGRPGRPATGPPAGSSPTERSPGGSAVAGRRPGHGTRRSSSTTGAGPRCGR